MLRRTRLSHAVHGALILALLPLAAQAQTTGSSEQTPPASPPDQQARELGTVTVTGSRIRQAEAVTAAPVSVITREDIEKSGIASIGELLQELTTSGSALNTKFNSSGNFGYPASGGGIGAGSAQVDLRHLESKRVLVLVDGIRWVNESSASGVSGSADLNTIPLAIVERVEVLEDGASAIYGSDAIAGVVNLITVKRFEGVNVHAYYGQFDRRDGDITDASVTVGGSGDRFSGVFAASFYDQKRINSSDRSLALLPVPGTGLTRGSSGTPQGRFLFCDPSRPPASVGFCDPGEENWYDLTLNTGTTTPVWNPADPTTGTYHNFSGSDRFNFAPYNLVLTPSRRKSVYASFNFDITANTGFHAKMLYNNRTSVNQAAPEPIFVGPGAGTGGIADTIAISALNPYNPFGINLVPGVNFDFIGRRPLEAGPRIFNQDVDTWYVNMGLDGFVTWGERSYSWDLNLVHSENKAEQVFYNGFNVAKLGLALGDPAICAAVTGCVPLDLFGGQGRPITQDMLDYVRVTTRDSSKQVLDLVTANITGDLFDIGDRAAGFALGGEHRKYKGDFEPDPLRQTGESQDSFAAPISADYTVDEVYGEIRLPLLSTLETTLALRWSDYSTFGNATTGKFGFKWRPIEDFVFRGTYSTGFRAPNLGELFGLTQFGATLTDPCSNAVSDADGINTTPTETACRAVGVPSGYEQNNTQITTFTGGNPNLQPEESDSYTLGIVYSPGWAEDLSWSRSADIELTYYHHKIDGAIQARDVQALLNACIAGTATGDVCAGFTRQPSGNLNPPTNFLDNLGSITTSGVDLKINWLSPEYRWGHLSGDLQLTRVNDYEAVDADGNVSSRQVGIEVNDSAIPRYLANLQVGWTLDDIDVTWNLRYIDRLTESCSDFLDGTARSFTALGLCSDPSSSNDAESLNDLASTTYSDLQLSWRDAFDLKGMRLSAGLHNAFDRDPPICLTCSLNGYDASTYDTQGRFWYVSVDYRFGNNSTATAK